MFKDGDVICFLGDSITASGLYMAEVYERIGAECDVRCYNVGLAGGTASLAEEYLYGLCLSKNPTHVVIMFAANDIDISLYSADCTLPDKDMRRQAAIEEHKRAYEKIVRDCLDFGCEVIITAPIPYDEWGKSETENLYCQSALDECAEFAMDIAKKYSLRSVDFRTPFLSLMRERVLISEDRQHPTPEGYHVMAEIFLFTLGYTATVDFDKKFKPADWNRRRMATEKKLRLIDFIDYVWLYREAKEKSYGIQKKIELSRERYGELEYKFSYVPTAYRAYFEWRDKKDALTDELVRLTRYPRREK